MWFAKRPLMPKSGHAPYWPEVARLVQDFRVITIGTAVDEYTSDRRFQLWRYEVGHAQLLLRSVKDDDHATRIDLLFKAVKAIDIPTAFDELAVHRSDESYLMSGRGWTGSITAGACLQAEDRGEYFEPSPFEESF